MKFNIDSLYPNEIGAIRIKKRFLYFPKFINGMMRWLEFAEWEEECTGLFIFGGWEPKKWIDLNDHYQNSA